MRVRCDRGVQERPCEGVVRPRQPCTSVPPFHFENLGKLDKNVWRSMAMQGLDPNRISTYVLGVLVLKNKGGVFLRGINRYKSSFHVSINAYFFLQSPKS